MLLGLERQGIIRSLGVNEASDYCAQAAFVPKRSNKLRFVVDFSSLNKYFQRPVHSFPSSDQNLQGIRHDTRFLASLDFPSGYFQLKLDKDSQSCTTFITEFGRYCFLRAPQGLNSSEYQAECEDDGTVTVSCALEDSPYLPSLSVMEICKSISLHLLRRSEESEVEECLRASEEDDESSLPEGEPTSLPNEDLPGECDDDSVGDQVVDENALIAGKNKIEREFILKNRDIFSESLGKHRHLLVEPMKILIRAAKSHDPSVYKYKPRAIPVHIR